MLICPFISTLRAELKRSALGHRRGCPSLHCQLNKRIGHWILFDLIIVYGINRNDFSVTEALPTQNSEEAIVFMHNVLLCAGTVPKSSYFSDTDLQRIYTDFMFIKYQTLCTTNQIVSYDLDSEQA